MTSSICKTNSSPHYTHCPCGPWLGKVTPSSFLSLSLSLSLSLTLTRLLFLSLPLSIFVSKWTEGTGTISRFKAMLAIRCSLSLISYSPLHWMPAHETQTSCGKALKIWAADTVGLSNTSHCTLLVYTYTYVYIIYIYIYKYIITIQFKYLYILMVLMLT